MVSKCITNTVNTTLQHKTTTALLQQPQGSQMPSIRHHDRWRRTGATPTVENSQSFQFYCQRIIIFPKWDQLPSPNEVQARTKAQHLAGVYPDQAKTHSMAAPYVWPPPAIFEELGLFVKWGSSAQLSEAQCLYAVRQSLKGDVPVPEVYGWRTEGNEKYIYMEYVNGTSLEQVWPIMGHEDKAGICRELRKIYQRLRQVEQDPEDPFIGTNKSCTL